MSLKDPNIKVEIKHSESKSAWNIIGISIPGKYKIARIPYLEIEGDVVLTQREKFEALHHAKFIQFCFNNSEEILKSIAIDEHS